MSHTYSPLLYCRIPQTFKYHKRCFYRAVYLLYNSQCTNIENSTNIELYFFLTRVYFNITFFTFHKLTPLYWRKKTIKNVTDPSLQIPPRQTLPLYIVSWETQIKIATPTSCFFSLFTNKWHDSVPYYSLKKNMMMMDGNQRKRDESLMDMKSVFLCVPWISNNSHNTIKLIWFYNALQYNTLVSTIQKFILHQPNTTTPSTPSTKNKSQKKIEKKNLVGI